MNRRLYNTAPMDNDGPSPTWRLAARILLIAALVSLVFLTVVTYAPGTSSLVYYWIYIVAYTLPIVLLLGALACRLVYAIKSALARRITVALLAFLILLVGTIAYSFGAVYNQFGMTPVAYYTHTESGRRVIIMKGLDADSTLAAQAEAAEAEGDEAQPVYHYVYGAYALRNRLLFQPLLGGEVVSDTGVDYVQWNDEGTQADVTIFDLDGVEQHILVDFNADEQALLAQRQAENAEASDEASTEDSSTAESPAEE